MDDTRANVDREVLMRELEHLREAMVRSDASGGSAANSPFAQPGTEPLHYCAYNVTRERFLGIDVEAADFLPTGLYEHLSTLEPKSSMALWITPFRGLSPDRVHPPVDLVFLDRNYCVLDIVESYPRFQPSTSRPPADSLLALPEETIARTSTATGDQLVLCAPDKMRRRLEILQMSKSNSPDSTSLTSHPAGSPNAQASEFKPPAQVIRWEDHTRQTPPDSPPIVEAAPKAIDTPKTTAPVAEAAVPAEVKAAAEAPAPPRETPQSRREAAWANKNWLQRWFSTEPLEPRSYPREVLPSMVAYFFNGGEPVPCDVRNVSLSGMYVNTSERWYLGTIVRMTLTNRNKPSSGSTITVNGLVVRWGDDGVGVHFVFQKSKQNRRASPPADDEPLVIVTQNQFKDFVTVIRQDSAHLN